MDEMTENDDAATRERPETTQNGDSRPQAIHSPEASELTVTTRDLQPAGDANDVVRSDSHRSASSATLSASALSCGARNPFDPRVSLKNPFPKFEDSMAGFRPDTDNKENDEESEEENNTSAFLHSSSTGTVGVNLEWSIDTIAELKPMAFSPLPEQKASFIGGENSLNDTPTSTANSNSKFDRFFDDEAQYKVLQTPSPLIRQQEHEREREQQNQFQYLQQSQQRQHSNASPSTPGPPPRAPTPPSIVHHSSSRRPGIPGSLSSSSTTSDLHRRCQNAIAFCEDRVRERQRKLSRLQLPQSGSSSFSSSPAPHHKKNKNKRFRGDASEFPWKTTPQQRTSELRGIHPRTPASAGTTTRIGFRPPQSPFSVPLTPIVSADQVLRTPERNSKAASQRKSMQNNEPEFSFDGGSPISPIAPFPGTGDCSGGSSNTLLDKTILEEAEYEEEKENESHGKNDASLSPIPRRAPAKDAPSFRSLSFSRSDEEHDKENRTRQQPSGRTKTSTFVPVLGSGSSSSDSPSFTLSSSWGKAAEDSFSLRTLGRLQSSTGNSNNNSLSSISFVSSLSSPPANPDLSSHSGSGSSSSSEPRSRSQPAAASRNDKKLASPSIAQRQESFMAAIEAEARASKPQTSSSATRSSCSTSSNLGSSTNPHTTGNASVAELFQEARALGISEPRAQWEYVQLLKKQRGQL